jgi:hypothetical protein
LVHRTVLHAKAKELFLPQIAATIATLLCFLSVQERIALQQIPSKKGLAGAIHSS